jgi:hypothetical protein
MFKSLAVTASTHQDAHLSIRVYKVVEIYRNLLVSFAKVSTLVELWKYNSHHDDSNKHVTSGSARR